MGKNTSEFTMRLYESKNRDAVPSIMYRIPRPLAKLLDDPQSLHFPVSEERVVMVEG